jgi:23S rRNA (adenine2503-C2)-methyltransferase
MGMGEPLDNATNLLKALEILTDPRAFGLGHRRITISTVGLIPGIQKLAHARRPWELSISLHAPNDRIRSEIMPVNRAYPVDRLLEAARQYTKLTKRYVTFEYILVRGVNDELETARELARKLRGMPCKVNLIPYNPIPEYPKKRPSLKAIRAFERTLRSRGVRVTVRFSKGGDINAACGQLRLHHTPTGSSSLPDVEHG